MTHERVARFVGDHQRKLELLQQMWADQKVQLYNDEKLPPQDEFRHGDSVFLAGPTSRHQLVECNWRCEAVSYLREAGFAGYIFCPEPRGHETPGDFTDRGYIHWWESERLLQASRKAFWVPRDGDELLGLNTNFEWGMITGMILAGKSVQVFIGWPDRAARMGLPHHYAMERAGCHRFTNLKGLCNAVAGKFSLSDVARVFFD